jgi:hypothetical protein
VSAAPESPSLSTGTESPTSDGQEVTAADGAISWTMPCQPEKENISGNEEDAKTYRSYTGWPRRSAYRSKNRPHRSHDEG